MHSLIDELSQTSTKSGKKAILQKRKDSKLVQEVLEYALNPYKTFGLRPEGTEPRVCGYNDDCFALRWPIVKETLDCLISRALSGDRARDAVNEFSTDDAVWPILWRILSKDLRCGTGEATVNSVWTDLIPRFKIALAETAVLDKLSFPIVAEYKLDGNRCLAHVASDGKVSLLSRRGLEYTGLERLRKLLEVSVPHGYVYDGELYSPSIGFDTISGAVRRGDDLNLDYYIFDAVPEDIFLSQGKSSSLDERKRFLNTHLDRFPTLLPHIVCYQQSDVEEVFDEAISLGYEGLVLKDPKAPYSYKRSTAWLKLKPTQTFEGSIVQFIEGTGKYTGMLGSMVVDINGVLTNVGSGFSDSQRESLWLGECPKGKMVEVLGQGLSPSGCVRFPRFLRFRPDLDE